MKILNFLNQLSEDDILKESFKDIDLKEISFIIERFLSTDKIDEKVCFEFYKKINLPYSMIYRSFGLVKSSIKDNKIQQKLDKLLNLTAKIYMKKEIVFFKKLLAQKRKHDFLLFKAHQQWVEDIVNAVKNDNLDSFPLIDAKHCKFNEYLSYLESLMICLDVNLCVYIYDLHNLIHSLANSFYIFYKKGFYSEAYFVFKDLKEQTLKFYNTLNELYISTFANVERSFFGLIEILVKSKKLYIGVVDLKNLKKLNSLFNENLITEAKNILYHKIHKTYKNRKNFLIIKGESNDFYIIASDMNEEEFEKEIKKIYEIIKEEIKINKETISFDAYILGIKLDKYTQLQIKDLINYLNFLKKIAKKENKNIIVNNKNNHLNEWIKEQFDINFVKEKLKNKDVDVVFQPIFDSNGNIFSIEALGRLKEENRLIPAGMFIDYVYSLGKIAEFDLLVLESILQKEHLIKQVCNRVFLNISFEALKNKKYIKKLNEVIQKMEIDIVLELTEQKFVESLQLIELIHKKNKTYFAVDDFGSGYSSILLVINLLKKNMIRVLKIDGTLIKNVMNDEYLKKAVKIIAGFRREFGLHLVAEFVEDKETFEFLKDTGIDLMQGYYLSMPKTIEELLVEREERIREIVS